MFKYEGKWIDTPFDCSTGWEYTLNADGLLQYNKPRPKEDAEQMTDLEKAIINTTRAVNRAWHKPIVDNFCSVKSIEVSVDHRTIVVIWADGDKTIVKRSAKDPDDLYMAFTAALAKKVYGSNSAIKRLIDKKGNEHKPKEKKETVRVVKQKKKEETE